MWKMVKYEYRKNLFSLLILLAGIILIEAYFVVALFISSEEHAAISFGILLFSAFASYLYVLLSGILSYAKDLKEKSGYLVFMAPLSSYSILGAKLIKTFITGLIIVIFYAAILIIDYYLGVKVFKMEAIIEMISDVIRSVNIDINEFILSAAIIVISVLVQFYSIITIGYLSLSIGYTILANKKGKGILSFIIFVLLTIAASWTVSHIPDFYSNQDVYQSLVKTLLNQTWKYCFELGVVIISYCLSSEILKRKLSL